MRNGIDGNEEEDEGDLRQRAFLNFYPGATLLLSRVSGVIGGRWVETLRDKIRDRFGGAEVDTSTR